MRLIDADALKYKNLAEVNGKLTHVLTAEEINNAETVEPEEVYMTAKDYNLFLEGYKQGKKDFERPQGEWIYHKAEGYFLPYMECSVCKAENLLGGISQGKYKTINKFCPNCGARMKNRSKLYE